MTLATSQTGTIQTIASLDGVSTNATVNPAGNTICKPTGSLPAAVAGSVASQSGCTILVPTGTLVAAQVVAVFWTVAGVLNAIYDMTVASVSTASPNDTVTLTNSGGTLGPANYYASSGSAPTGLPANATGLNVAIAQDVTNSVSIVGSDLQMLLITSTQQGLCELFDSGPTERLFEPILAAGGFYSWPSYAGQSVPFSQTVVKARMYNAALTAATMTVAALLA